MTTDDDPNLAGWTECSQCAGIPTGYASRCMFCTRPLAVTAAEALRRSTYIQADPDDD